MSTSRILYTPPEFQKKKKRLFKRTLSFFGLAILAVLLLSGTVYFLRLPKWQIRSIEISGLKTLKTEEVSSGISDFLKGVYFGLIPKSSAFALDSDGVGRYLKEKFPRIASVAVTKILPDRLNVSVKEREFFGILCNDLFLPNFVGTTTPSYLRNPEPRCVYLDNTGFAYENGPSSSGTLILKISTDLEEIKIPSQVFDQKLLGEMLDLKKRLAEIEGAVVLGYEFLFRVPTEIKVLSGDGFKIIFSRDEDMENPFRVLKKVLEEEVREKRGDLEYIDLRFGNKVFYKFKQ